MKKQKIFMPPNRVKEEEKIGDVSLTLDEVRKMYRDGGVDGTRWSRRILRQEGILKAETEGDVLIPVAIDLQLGSDIFAGYVELPCEEVVAKFEEGGISASCIPHDKGTLVFFVDPDRETEEATPINFPVKKVVNKGMVMIDESKAKIKSIMRAVWKSDDTAGFTCYGVDTNTHLIDSVPCDQLYLLKSYNPDPQSAQIIKVDNDLGIVLGWAIITTINGDPYFDKQGDHITDAAMLDASVDFMMNCRVQGDMHEKEADGVKKDAGTVVMLWPMTAEIAKAFNMQTEQTGLMIAIKPDDDEILEKFRDGTYTGFSIGGHHEHVEEVG